MIESVVMTNAEKLQFAIDFSERDLSRVSQGEWSAFTEDHDLEPRGLQVQLLNFLQRPDSSTLVSPSLYQRYPKKKLLQLQQEVHGLLQRLLAMRSKGEAVRRRGSVHISAVEIHVSVTYTLEVGQKPPVWRPGEDLEPPVLWLSGSIRGVFMGTLFEALGAVGLQGIRQCVCGRFFARVHRQKYCKNPVCAQDRKKAYWADYVKSPRGVAARERQYAKGGWTVGGRRKGSAAKRKK